jgi:regulator of RNase E activity RraB
MFRVSVSLLKPGRDGVAGDQAEIENLGNLADAVLKALEAVDGQFVCMATSNSVRSWIIYVAKPDGVAELIQGAFGQQTDYRPVIELVHDPAWSAYLSLYPTGEEQEGIRRVRAIRSSITRSRAMTAAIVKDLIQKGDDRSPREINYSIDFATVEGREAFITRLDEKSFKLGKQNDPTEGHRQYSLNVDRTDPLEIARIVHIEEYLIRLAAAHGGKYDGWGCFMQPRGSLPKARD